MKVLLYCEGKSALSKSGIGRAFEHQKKALSLVGVDYTTDKNCEDYDLLHINTYGLNSLNMIHDARKMNKKIIYHAHSNGEDVQNSFIGSNQAANLYKKYLVSLYSKADYLITPTVYAKEILESYEIKKPMTVISNGIELEKYAPSKSKEQKFREYFNLADDQKVIISVGLYFHRKGLTDFVELARNLPGYTFIWFGYTPLYTIPEDIRKIVKKDHPENVLFPGYIKGEVIEGAYSNADIFFFPSYEETEGIVVLEALASHQKVLVRDIPVYKGWLSNNQNVYMGNNNQEFQQKIVDIIEGQAADLTTEGFKVAQERTLNKVGQQLKTLYQNVLTSE